MESPILYIDNYICILSPDSEYGIEIVHYSKYNICEGLYSYNGLMKYNKSLPFIRPRNINDDFIFFRPPKFPDRESYIPEYEYAACIKVDPDTSFVYSSELRHSHYKFYVQSRTPLSKYYKIRAESLAKIQNKTNLIYNQITHIINKYYGVAIERCPEDHIQHYDYPVEILANIDYIPPEFMTRCYCDGNLIFDHRSLES